MSSLREMRPALDKCHGAVTLSKYPYRRQPIQTGGGGAMRNAWKSRAPGPHAHGNAARQVVDGLRTEVCGQQKQSNHPRNNQKNPNTPTTARR